MRICLWYTTVATESGVTVGNKNFIDRMEHCESVCKKVMSLKNDATKLKMKTFHLMCDFESFMNDYLPTVTQDIDGLIFTPINCPVKIGTHETMFKWKPKEKNTVDFKVKVVGNQWRLYVQEKGELMLNPSYQVKKWIHRGSEKT